MADRTRFTIVLFSLLASTPVLAQWGEGSAEEIRPRFRTADRNQESGWCKLRIRVDGEVIVTMQRDRVRVRRLSGQPASDEGSECSSPLPARIGDFEFDKTDGRGRASVENTPEGDGRVVLRVRDGDGGSDKYTLEFKWRRDLDSGRRDRWDDLGRRDRWEGSPGRGSSFDIRAACRQELRARISSEYRASVARQLDERIRSADGQREELTGRAEAVRDGETRIVEYRCVVNPRQGRILEFDQRFVESVGVPSRRR